MKTIDNVHFGAPGKPLPDWRKQQPHEADDGNDLDAECPPDVEAVLGFDPDKEKL